MKFKCGICNEEHSGLPPVLEFLLPHQYRWFLFPWNRKKLHKINENACHYANRKHYIRGEIILPFSNSDQAISFFVWLRVSKLNFESYLEFRANENEEDPPELLPAFLSNLVPEYESEYCKPVWFSIERGNPIVSVTMYYDESPLSLAMKNGLPESYKHTLAEVLEQLN